MDFDEVAPFRFRMNGTLRNFLESRQRILETESDEVSLETTDVTVLAVDRVVESSKEAVKADDSVLNE